jgi:hypothetical protein
MVQAGIRFLKLDEAKQAEAREKTPAPLFEKIEAEAAAIQFVLLAAAIWHEQGVLDDVLTYVREWASGQASLDVAA